MLGWDLDKRTHEECPKNTWELVCLDDCNRSDDSKISRSETIVLERLSTSDFLFKLGQKKPFLSDHVHAGRACLYRARVN
jgi:hypothetical protein